MLLHHTLVCCFCVFLMSATLYWWPSVQKHGCITNFHMLVFVMGWQFVQLMALDLWACNCHFFFEKVKEDNLTVALFVSCTAEDGSLLEGLPKVKVLRNNRREGWWFVQFKFFIFFHLSYMYFNIFTPLASFFRNYFISSHRELSFEWSFEWSHL